MKKRKISKRTVISFIMMLLCIISNVYLVYSLFLLSGIETLIRVVVSSIITLLDVCLIYGFLTSIKKKDKMYIIYTILGLIFSIILLFVGHYIIKTYKVVDNFTTDSTTYSTSLVTLKDNKVDDIKKVDGKVGMLDDQNNTVGYIIPTNIIDENNLDVNIKKYSSYVELIKALYMEEVDYIFLPTNYVIMFSNYEGEDFSTIGEDTKIIYTKNQKIKSKSNTKKTSSLTKPFTVLLMGVDSEDENIAGSSFNGDSLMLITFNPNTLNATILSIPRDSYVPIACTSGKSRSKITHAAWYGENCMIDTIENFTGITIDYYVKINFKGLVKIVETLGGIDVDVPYSFCEQDSNRRFGNNTVYVDKGFQTLNGEQALAFSRNRHPWPAYCGKKYSNYESNDFVRGQNQQKVLTAILDKIKQNGNLQTIYNLLDVVSSSMETNMSTNEILSLYNIGKDVISKSSNSSSVADVIGMQRLYLSGKDAHIMDSLTGMNLYFYVLFNESIDEISKAMKINLEQEEAELIKEFNFDVDEKYESKVIGQIDTGTTISYKQGNKNVTVEEDYQISTPSIEKEDKKEIEKEQIVIPNFSGLTYKESLNEATKLGIYINAQGNTNGVVIKQDLQTGTKVDSGITIKLTFEKEEEKEDEKEDVVQPGDKTEEDIAEEPSSDNDDLSTETNE